MKWFLGLFSPSLNFRAYFTFSQAHIYQFDHLQMFITGLKCPFCDYFVFFFLFLLYLLSFIIIISVFSKSPSVLLCVFFRDIDQYVLCHWHRPVWSSGILHPTVEEPGICCQHNRSHLLSVFSVCATTWSKKQINVFCFVINVSSWSENF